MGACFGTTPPVSSAPNATASTAKSNEVPSSKSLKQEQSKDSTPFVERALAEQSFIAALQPKPESEFKLRYDLKGVLGQGSYSVVRKAIDKDSKQPVAVKVIDRRKLTKEDEVALRIEVEILGKLRHPNIIKLFGWYVEGRSYCVIFELMNGGELFDRIVKKEFYSEADAQKVVFTLASVVQYIHSNNIAHRDLKPENILLTDESDSAIIKIADFGFARPVTSGLTTACGTPGYVAPEIIGGKPYGKAVDVWSLGVIIYILLCGYPPFYNTNQAQLFKTIRAGKFVFDSPYWDPISGDAKDLISGCLTVDHEKRLKIDQVLEHPWVVNRVENKDITNVLGELKKFNARRKLRAAIKAAIAANRLIDIADTIRQQLQEPH